MLAGCGGSDPGTTSAPTTTEPATTSTAAVAVGNSGSDADLSTEEVRFQSGEFELVGDLHLPDGEGPYPALILVHSSGPQTRDSTPSAGLLRLRFLDAGYAVLSWDKPGSGETTGDLDSEYKLTELATILADAIDLLADDPRVDPEHIGVWGLSEAGWVMPLAMTMTDGVAFMMVVSGGAEDSIEQMVYQWGRNAVCRGGTEEEAALMEEHGGPALKAATYGDYRRAMEVLLTIPDLDSYVGADIEMATEDEWVPWPPDIDAFFDPITVIEQTTIPVLAIFGELDIQVDPIQGAEAYQAALERAGNPMFHVELIPDVGHTLTPATDSGCVTGSGGYVPRYTELIDEWIERLQSL